MTGLQNRVDSFDVDAWRRRQRANPGRPVPRTALAGDTSQLHNPYAGIPYAWQLTETVEDFLDRLPPETTTSDQVPWIFICNPYIHRVGKRQSDKWQVKGRDNDDEGPDEEGANVQIVVQGGEERLQLVRDLLEKASQTDMVKSVKEREANKERRQAAADILTLAHAYRVRAGKVPSYEHILDYAIREKLTVNSQWMLFCQPQEVNEVWAIVAKATAANELGIAAKVAPKSADGDARRDRLICVYTADFRDRSDVGRVLQKLRELRLVESRGRPIYYKPGECSATIRSRVLRS